MNRSFTVVKNNVEDGVYPASINGFKIKDNRIYLELCLENGLIFRPSSISMELTENNPLYQYFKKLGYSDNEIPQIQCEDLIGENAVFTIQNEEGNTVIFSNIVNIEFAN